MINFRLLLTSTALLLYTIVSFGQVKNTGISEKQHNEALNFETNQYDQIFNKAIPATVQIIGLGEVSHGGYEPIAFKAGMTKFLIEERGYRTILFEQSDVALIREIRAYLNDVEALDTTFIKKWVEKADFTSAISSAYLELFEWIKLYNSKYQQDKIQVRGFELATEQNNIEFLLNTFIIPFDPKASQKHVNRLYTEAEDIDKLEIINQWFHTNKSCLQASLNETDFNWLKFYIENTINGLTYQTKKGPTDSQNISLFRDSVLASNVNLLSGGAKSVVWAHNGHVIRTATKHMGYLLNQKLGSHYFVIATDFSGHAAVQFMNRDPETTKENKYVTAIFKSAPSTVAYKLYDKYQVPEGIFFQSDLTDLQIGNDTNAIDARGVHVVIPGTTNAFDALLVFKNVYPVPEKN